MNEDQYDLYGKSGIAFDDGFIDRPSGQAAQDYTQWLTQNPNIARDIERTIRKNAEENFPFYEWKKKDDKSCTLEQATPENAEDPEVKAKKIASACFKLDRDPWWSFKPSDWGTKGSQEADLNDTFKSLWGTLSDENASLTEKSGASILSIAQYF